MTKRLQITSVTIWLLIGLFECPRVQLIRAERTQEMMGMIRPPHGPYTLLKYQLVACIANRFSLVQEMSMTIWFAFMFVEVASLQ